MRVRAVVGSGLRRASNEHPPNTQIPKEGEAHTPIQTDGSLIFLAHCEQTDGVGGREHPKQEHFSVPLTLMSWADPQPYEVQNSAADTCKGVPKHFSFRLKQVAWSVFEPAHESGVRQRIAWEDGQLKLSKNRYICWQSFA